MTDRSFAAPRTLLAWRRTALTAGAYAALLLRLGLVQDRPWDLAAAAIAGITAAAAFVRGRRPSDWMVSYHFISLTAACALVTAAVTVAALLA